MNVVRDSGLKQSGNPSPTFRSGSILATKKMKIQGGEIIECYDGGV
ncbi:MAG: hypothetical protein RSA29_14660 [Clostridium sp.]